MAPLLDNDRRKIELLNSILFTLPGSPVIYYGDEIGMGDNIWLDDRNGVRTPMQWTDGPNAGFSGAPPESLYVSVIDDPVYGYRRVNIAAQRADPDSLLNFMRRLIALRQEHPCFGRGTFELVDTGNRAVLAYRREYKGERVLALHNLTAAAQQVAVTDGSYIDLLTGESYPSARLALTPYQYLWLA